MSTSDKSRIAADGASTVKICMGTACYVKGASELLYDLEEQAENADYVIRGTGCLGHCHNAGKDARTPYVTVNETLVENADIENVLRTVRDSTGGT